MILVATPSLSGMPRVTMLLDAIPSSAARVTVWRSYAGVRSVVRDANRALTGGSSSRPVTDFEVPLGVEVTYTAAAYSAAGGTVAQAQAVPVTIVSDATWISDPLAPGKGGAVDLIEESLLEITRQTPGDMQTPLESGLPIAVMGTTAVASFALRFLAPTLAAGDVIIDVLESADPFLLRTPPAAGFRVPALTYVAQSEFTITRVAPQRDHIAIGQATAVAAPVSPVVLSPRTLGDVMAEASTLGELAQRYDTLLELYWGN